MSYRGQVFMVLNNNEEEMNAVFLVRIDELNLSFMSLESLVRFFFWDAFAHSFHLEQWIPVSYWRSHLRLVSMRWISTGDSTKQEQENPWQGFRFYESLPKVFEVDDAERGAEL